MIRYDLKCTEGHEFEAWFASSSAYDDQAARGLVMCAICGSSKVEKALMTPRVPKKGRSETTPSPDGSFKDISGSDMPHPLGDGGGASHPEIPGVPSNGPLLSAPGGVEVERKLAALRAEIEKNSTYVGKAFASEARRMHVGETDQRAIHGEASANDVKALVEDGVPVAPLPFLPRRDD